MDAFPAFFPLAGRSVAIAGEGEAAEAKARLFEGSPATVVRLSPVEALDPRSYAGMTLAFIAGADDHWAWAAAEAARAASVPVNVVDRPALCDFTTPAVIDRGEVVAAIGTGGASPMLATMLRQDIEARMPEGAGRVAALFRMMQGEIRAALPDANARRRFLRAALNGPAAEAAMTGDMDGAKERLRASLFDGPQMAGRIRYIDGRGPADLLTLRALRALAAADVLVCDPDTHPDVLALARRDAERLGGGVEALVELVSQGLVVARLITGAGWRTEQATLEQRGVATDVLPIAG